MEHEVLHTKKIPTIIDFEVLLHVPDRPAPYHLRGVIEHHGGTTNSGHYTSYVRAANNLWYYCNDEASPQRVATEEVLKAQAYVLIYER